MTELYYTPLGRVSLHLFVCRSYEVKGALKYKLGIYIFSHNGSDKDSTFQDLK
jgi:hypothetical protein